MKYALVNGKKIHIRDVDKGTIGNDIWFPDYKVKACKGHFMQYWKYVDAKPSLPEGYENETEWHALWKDKVKPEYCEVICGDNNEHRADIKTDEFVIEIQKSPISYEAAEERTRFYKDLTEKRLIWIINVYYSWWKKNITIERIEGEVFSELKWAHKKKWIYELMKQQSQMVEVYLDVSPFGDSLYRVWVHDGRTLTMQFSKNKFFDDKLKLYSEECNDFASTFNGLRSKDYK